MEDKEPTERMTASMPKPLKQLIQKAAREHFQTDSEFVRMACKEWIDKHKK